MIVSLVTLTLLGTAAVASPAQAAVPDRWAFAYMHDPNPMFGTIMDPTRQWGSWKTAAPGLWATVDPAGFGRYLVRFPQTVSPPGVIHVTAFSSQTQPRWCQIASSAQVGPERVIEVACFRPGGAPDPGEFTISFSSSSGTMLPPTGSYGYVVADPFGGILTSYNSAGAGNTVTHLMTGMYQVTLPALGGGFQDGNLQVTAESFALPRRCKVGNWNVVGTTQNVLVLCFDAANALADSGFHLTYHRERSVFGGLQPPKAFAYLWSPGLGGPADYNSAGAVNSIMVSGFGLNLVRFPLVGVGQTHVQVTAYGFSPDWCGLQFPWVLAGTDVLVRNVICFDGTGATAPNPYFVSYTSEL